MDKDVLIKKWLDHNLTEAEKKVFEASDDFAEERKIQKALDTFMAPPLDKAKVWEAIQTKTQSQPERKISWLKPLSAIAAVLVIGFVCCMLRVFWISLTQQVRQSIWLLTYQMIPVCS